MAYKAIRTDSKPWYKYFWPWFLIGVFIWTLFSGIGMVYFSSQHKYNLIDGFDKIGKVVTDKN